MTSRNKREGWYAGRLKLWRDTDPGPFKLHVRFQRTKRYAASLEGFKAWNRKRTKDGKTNTKERPMPW